MADERASLTWRQASQRVIRAWKPLVIYELMMSWISFLVLGPLALIVSYRLIELSGESVLGNKELARFFLSPTGLIVLILGLSTSLGLLLVEYSGLILIVHAALRDTRPTIRQVLWMLIAKAPRLFALAVIQTAFAILAALPFLGLAALTYWLLLSDADINYFLDQQPPRFWVAVAIGVVLAAALAAIAGWFFIRWAFALPACVLDGQSAWGALRSSWRLVRPRGLRLLGMFVAWIVIKQVALVGVVAGLDFINYAGLASFETGLITLIVSTIVLLLIDTAALQVLGAIFSVALALVITYEYDRACRADSGAKTGTTPQPVAREMPAGRARLARNTILAILVVGPLASIVYALVLSQGFIEHRRIKVAAHRAGYIETPENSLAALRSAIEIGADLAEIDVQQTADGHLVLMHDRDLRRMTGDPRDVNDVTLAELAPLRLRGPNGPTDEHIPTLEEFIDTCDGKIDLLIELKDYGRTPGLAMAVLDTVREKNFADHAIICGFQMGPLQEIRNSKPPLPVGLLISASQGDITTLPVDFLSINQRLVRGDLVRRAHSRGLDIYAWTVNDRDIALRLMDLGCDGLITSNPAFMREVVDWYEDQGDAERVLLRLRRWMRE